MSHLAAGCEELGHLASPFVDGELPEAQQARFAAHLDGCPECRTLTREYRALDRAASPEPPEISETRWQLAWLEVQRAVEADRAARERSPLAPLWRWLDRLRPTSLPAWLRPLPYAAAAAVLVALLIGVQQAARREPIGPSPTPVPAGAPLAAPATLRSVSCNTPGTVPVVYTTGGDDPITVVQCVVLDS